MTRQNTLNNIHELTGRPVLVPDTLRLLGKVSEVIRHPSNGVLLGLVLQTPEGTKRMVLGKHCRILSDVWAVLAAAQTITAPVTLAELLSTNDPIIHRPLNLAAG